MTDKKSTDQKKPETPDTQPTLSTSFVMSSNPAEDAKKVAKDTQDNKASSKKTTGAATAKDHPVKAAKSTPSSSKTRDNKATSMKNEQPVKKSATGLIALILALCSLIALAGYYWWHQQEQVAFQKTLIEQNIKKNQELSTRITQLLEQKNAQIKQTLTHDLSENKQRLEAMERSIASLSQNQPSDWLVYEAEYLIRIAARSLWLEQDKKGAVSLLQEAAQRIKELKDPQFLPVRQAIHQDVAAIKLLPELKTEAVIMSLMGLGQQIKQLRFNHVYLPEATAPQEDLTLSEDTADWRSNLAKTWQRFLADFITVSRRTANVEPLMSPQHQQNLQANLALKLQQAQWAAAEQNAAMYKKTLDEIVLWLQQYYSKDAEVNQRFIAQITSLKTDVVQANYPATLSAHAAIRKLMAQKNGVRNKDTKGSPNDAPSLTEALLQPQLKQTKPEQEVLKKADKPAPKQTTSDKSPTPKARENDAIILGEA